MGIPNTDSHFFLSSHTSRSFNTSYSENPLTKGNTMETIQTLGAWMMAISTSLIIFALVMVALDDRPKKDPNKR